MSILSSKEQDRLHDEAARALTPDRVYETTDGSTFYVIHVDHGSKPGEFKSGRRPASAKVLMLTSGLAGEAGTLKWLLGVRLVWLMPKAIT